MAFLQIITDNILPLLVFVAIGYLMDKKYHLDVGSLTKLTFYIILPCFIFIKRRRLIFLSKAARIFGK